MTWSNVGDEPGRVKRLKEPNIPRGDFPITSKKKNLGHHNPESPQARKERLQKIARGKK